MTDNTVMSGTAVQEIAKLAQQAQEAGHQVVKFMDRVFAAGDVRDITLGEKLPAPAPLVVHSLTGFIAYVHANRDKLDLAECVVHVCGPDMVTLLGPLTGNHQQRFVYLRAELYDRIAAFPSFRFGHALDLESMIIALQALFVDTPERAELLRLLGNVTGESVRQVADDGTAQEVTVRVGASMKDRERVPNPIMLQPFRTFDEVVQPASPFVVRLKQAGEGEVRIALFEADGGMWRSIAITAVAGFLGEELADTPVEIIA